MADPISGILPTYSPSKPSISIIMPPAANVSTLAKLSAQSSGTVNASPLNMSKLVFSGETLAWIRAGLPKVNCHQGENKETTIRLSEAIPLASPNQLIFWLIDVSPVAG